MMQVTTSVVLGFFILKVINQKPYMLALIWTLWTSTEFTVSGRTICKLQTSQAKLYKPANLLDMKVAGFDIKCLQKPCPLSKKIMCLYLFTFYIL